LALSDYQHRKREYDKKYRKEHKEHYEAYFRAYRNDPEHQERHLISSKKYRKKNADKISLYQRIRRLRLVGLNEQNFQVLKDLQGNKCAICGKDFAFCEPQVDHNHLTQEIRGLLCKQCNLMLGFSREDPETLLRAVLYLENKELR
jgi:hypothetical protein